jgi:hypothetical protein
VRALPPKSLLLVSLITAVHTNNVSPVSRGCCSKRAQTRKGDQSRTGSGCQLRKTGSPVLATAGPL